MSRCFSFKQKWGSCKCGVQAFTSHIPATTRNVNDFSLMPRPNSPCGSSVSKPKTNGAVGDVLIKRSSYWWSNSCDFPPNLIKNPKVFDWVDPKLLLGWPQVWFKVEQKIPVKSLGGNTPIWVLPTAPSTVSTKGGGLAKDFTLQQNWCYIADGFRPHVWWPSRSRLAFFQTVSPWGHQLTNLSMLETPSHAIQSYIFTKIMTSWWGGPFTKA